MKYSNINPMFAPKTITLANHYGRDISNYIYNRRTNLHGRVANISRAHLILVSWFTTSPTNRIRSWLNTWAHAWLNTIRPPRARTQLFANTRSRSPPYNGMISVLAVIHRGRSTGRRVTLVGQQVQWPTAMVVAGGMDEERRDDRFLHEETN